MFTGFYAGILGLWLAFLYLSVVHSRKKYKAWVGHGGKEPLYRAIRIHGNFIETVPFILIMMLLMEGIYAKPVLVHIFGVLLILTRILHYLGFSKSSGASTERMAAGILTMLLMVAGGLLLVYGALVHGSVLSF